MQCKSAGCFLLETTAYRACWLHCHHSARVAGTKASSAPAEHFRRRSLAFAEWREVEDRTIESRGARITGLMQDNVRYMKFLYEWFAGYKDSRLKQISCAKC